MYKAVNYCYSIFPARAFATLGLFVNAHNVVQVLTLLNQSTLRWHYSAQVNVVNPRNFSC